MHVRRAWNTPSASAEASLPGVPSVTRSERTSSSRRSARFVLATVQPGVTDYRARDGNRTDHRDTQMTISTAEGPIRADNRHADLGICNVPAVIHRATCAGCLPKLVTWGA